MCGLCDYEHFLNTGEWPPPEEDTMTQFRNNYNRQREERSSNPRPAVIPTPDPASVLTEEERVIDKVVRKFFGVKRDDWTGQCVNCGTSNRCTCGRDPSYRLMIVEIVQKAIKKLTKKGFLPKRLPFFPCDLHDTKLFKRGMVNRSPEIGA